MNFKYCRAMYVGIFIAAVFVSSGCGSDEQTVEPVAEPRDEVFAHQLDSDCESCHPGYGTPNFNEDPSAKVILHGEIHCWDCHDPVSPTSNISGIHDYIWTPFDGSRRVVFLQREGPNSFADGDATYDGICEVCHTTTSFHRNDAAGDHGHSAGGDCAVCHSHRFDWMPVAGDCLSCHDRPQPEGAGEYRRQIVTATGSGGDFVRTSHHVTDGSQNQIVTAADCVVCHDQANHRSYTDGVSVLLNNPAGGTPLLYDGSPTSLEFFCTSCHDGTHSSPFSSGNPAPPLSPNWGSSGHAEAGVTCFAEGGCHVNGHGSDNQHLLRAALSLQDEIPYSSSAYALCWECHDEQRIVFGDNRFEDLHERHLDREDTPCAMCHGSHAAYDAGEPGLIDFSYAIEIGRNTELIDGRDLSQSFWISEDGSEGFCYIRCHGKRHRSKDYERR